MRITIELRRPARRSIALLLGVLLLTAPAVVLASHQFPDVPTGHPFHTQISAIAKAGITAGFDDGGYHPSEAVTRQAMAAFMQRGFGSVWRNGLSFLITSNFSVTAGNSTTPVFLVRSLTVTVPGASNAFTPSQFVHVTGRVAFDDSMNNASMGCPCQFTASISDGTTVSPGQFQSFESASTQAAGRSMDIDAVFVAPPGPRTYTLRVALTFRDSTTNNATFDLDGSSSLTATSYPFGDESVDVPSGADPLNAGAGADRSIERSGEE